MANIFEIQICYYVYLFVFLKINDTVYFKILLYNLFLISLLLCKLLVKVIYSNSCDFTINFVQSVQV